MHISRAWFGAAVVLVIGVALLAGVDLARSNSDIICTRTFQDSGSCTSGAWGTWTILSQNTDNNACNATFHETRTYTGLRNTISSNISVRANLHTHCNLSDDAFRGGTGTITSQYSACQIQETRTRVVTGNGTGASCVITNATTSQGHITDDTNIETTGDVATSTTVSGTYQDYLNMVDARLATSTLAVVPSLVHSGATTQVIWTSSHVKTCTVSGGNGDGLVGSATGLWNTLVSAAGGEKSSPIMGQTTYTLVCTTAIGTHLTSTATVNLIPKFNEQ